MKGTLHEDQCTFMITSRSVFLKAKKKYYRQNLEENQNTLVVFKNVFRKILLFIR